MAETNLYKILDKIIDKLKLVKGFNTTGFVKKGSEITSLEGLTPSPIIDGVPYYKEVSSPEYSSIERGLYFDFTVSDIDLISYVPIDLQNLTISSNGLEFNNLTCYATLPGDFLRKNTSYEIEISSLNISDTTHHNDLFRFKDLDNTSNAGLIYRYQTQTWSIWDSTNGWQDSQLTDKNYFNDSILKIKILSDGVWEVYKNDSLLFSTPNPVVFEGTSDFGLGSPNNCVVDMSVKTFRTYVNEHESDDGTVGAPFVPITRTINNKPLSTDITLNSSDIGIGIVNKTSSGLVPQLPNETSTDKFFRQDGTWGIPAGGSGGSEKSVFYGVCETASSDSSKIVTLEDSFTLSSGKTFIVKFLYDVVRNSTLNINNTGIYPLKYRNHNIRNNDICSQDKASLVFDGTSYNIISVDSINYSTDIEMRITPSYLGQVSPGSGRMCQGITSDGTYLYMASISTSDFMSDPIIYKIDTSTLEVTPKSPAKKGHYNSLNYYNGYIYATGFNTNDINDDYSQIYKYNYSNNSGSIITTDEWYWTFAIGSGPYNSKFYIGHIASRPAFSVYSTVNSSSMSFYPWSQSPTDYYNGVEQGCAIYDSVSNNSHYNYVCTIITDYRTVYPDSTHSSHILLVTNLTGKIVKRIRLFLPNGLNEELEDVCFIGNKCYINSSTGRIYVIEDITKLFRGFYENVYPVVWQKPCWMYINTNGSETWYTGTYGSSSGRLLKSFRLSPFTIDSYHFSNATGMFVFRGKHFPIKVNPTSGNITIQINAVIDNYEYNITLTYNRTSDSSNYIYNLYSITGGYRNASGTLTQQNANTASGIQTCCNNMFYDSDSYIHHIISNTTVPYTYVPTNL